MTIRKLKKMPSSLVDCPTPCPHCHYPGEFGFYSVDDDLMCVACYMEIYENVPRVKANRFRYVRPEYKCYPNDRGEGKKIPNNQDAWNAYFDFGGSNVS